MPSTAAPENSLLWSWNRIRPAHQRRAGRVAGAADERTVRPRPVRKIREGAGCGAHERRVVEMISRKIRRARPEHRRAALERGGVDGRLELGGVLRGDDRSGLGCRLHRQPHVGRGPFAAPDGLIVLREPAVDGGAVEGHPELIVGGGAVLLHVAARVGDERGERRILLRGPPAGDPHEHDLEGGLERGRLRGLGSVGNGHGRLIELGTRERQAHVGAQDQKSQAQKYRRTQIPPNNALEISCHGVIGQALEFGHVKYHSLAAGRPAGRPAGRRRGRG